MIDNILYEITCNSDLVKNVRNMSVWNIFNLNIFILILLSYDYFVIIINDK